MYLVVLTSGLNLESLYDIQARLFPSFQQPPQHFLIIVSLDTTHCDEFTKSNMISCFEPPCGRHSSERSLLY